MFSTNVILEICTIGASWKASWVEVARGEWRWLARLVALVVGALMSLFEKWPDVSMAGVGGVVSTSLAGSGRRLKRTQGNREHVEFGANLMGTAPSKIFTECREVCFS